MEAIAGNAQREARAPRPSSPCRVFVAGPGAKGLAVGPDTDAGGRGARGRNVRRGSMAVALDIEDTDVGTAALKTTR